MVFLLDSMSDSIDGWILPLSPFAPSCSVVSVVSLSGSGSVPSLVSPLLQFLPSVTVPPLTLHL